MSRYPRISVLLPVRDAGPFLPAALDSLEAQTFTDFEVLGVDDGSSDNSLELLRGRASRDPRFRVVQQSALGVVHALETARALATGEYLARMDADDITPPDRLERQLALLGDSPDLVACGCRVRYFPRDQLKDGSRLYERWINGLTTAEAMDRDVFVECPVAHPTMLVRASAVDGVGGYRDMGWPEDYDLVLRLWRASGRFGLVRECVHRWRAHEGRLSRNDPAYSADQFRRCKVHHLMRSLIPKRDGAVVWGAGPTGKGFARALQAAGTELRAFVDLDPRKIGQEIHGAPVVAPEGVDEFRGALCLAAVSGELARQEIRGSLEARGWSEMVDFVAVA